MARAITIYEANDGTRFNTKHEAVSHDALCLRISAVERLLRPHPDNHKSCVFQPQAELFKRELLALGASLFPHESGFRLSPQQVHPMSGVGRFVSECAPMPYQRLWHRWACMATGDVEYEQPFYALNPDQYEGPPPVRDDKSTTVATAIDRSARRISLDGAS